MLISINRIRELIGDSRWQMAAELCRHGGVREESAAADYASYLVNGTPAYRIMLRTDRAPSCTCAEYAEKGACIHLAAAAVLAQQNGTLIRLNRLRAAQAGPLLFDAMETVLPGDTTLKMEISILNDGLSPDGGAQLRLGLRIGQERLYVVRSLPALIDAIDHDKPLDFGKGFSLRPSWMRFGVQENRVIDLLRTLFSAQGEAISSLRGADLRLFRLPQPFARQLLDILRETPFRYGKRDETSEQPPIREAALPLRFRVSGQLQGLTIDGYLPREFEPLTADCRYVKAGSQILCVPEQQLQLVRSLWQQTMNNHAGFAYTVQQTPRVVGELLPFLRLCGVVEIERQVDSMLLRLPLTSRVYLDRAGRDISARVEFCYGDRTIDPFDDTPAPTALVPGEKLLLRDGAAERQVLDQLGASGFHIHQGRVYLSSGQEIWRFVSEGLDALQQKCQVFASREFRHFQPRRPQLKGSMRMDGGRLQLALTADEEPSDEILAIMEALARRKDYFRLKDGSFLDLTQLDDWQPVAEAVAEAASAEGEDKVLNDTVLSLSACRLAWLGALLKEKQLQLEADDTVEETIRLLSGSQEDDIPAPEGIDLRPYQQRGYRWLHTLDRLHMGGILADDMGLGKTVQVISLLQTIHSAAKAKGEHPVSLVVSPTSLTYNWLHELGRFAPELSVMVMNGSGPQRAGQLEHVRRAMDVDVLITSYPLIRRDIELMQDMHFRFAVLDEAQQIKNAGSVGAVAVKQLQADTRFALTGTPMENSMGELWSIFDYVLPGYLGSYAGFMRKYQQDENLDELRRRIRPFLMRRLKRDVLTELPDKTETVLTAQMTPEQEQVYRAALVRLRGRVDRLLAEKGLSRGRAEVLSAMTELRQICCHPSLVLETYSGSSGKLQLLLDILPGSLMAGRRVLLFSQFTGMLRLLRRQLEESSISCLYLDGDTPSASRLEMVDRFNGGVGQVFLISLKAGGMGLNLTGADMVIHYDPWWNPAAEDQATDRAHRIGQTHKVDVVRLVTHGSIEEQVIALGQRKRALFDQLITPGEQLVTALTEADIRALFD